MSEDALRNRIRELEQKLKQKDLEIEQLEDTIEQREDTIMELEAIKELEDGAKTKSKKIQAAESRFAYELEEKEKYIRDLKNAMGKLRKDYTQLQQEFEKFKLTHQESSVIRVEDFREKPPLNALVADLQDKVNKQKSLINKLEFQLKESAEFNEKLKEKDDAIEIYKTEINELNQKITELSSNSQSESGESMTKKLIEDLQKQLNKSKRQILDLKQKLSKFDKKSRKPDKKDQEIEKLKNEIKSLKEGDITTDSDQTDMASSEVIHTLKDDLQNKLNKSKLEVKALQEELKRYKTGALSETSGSPKEIEGKLKLQREMTIFLQKQLEAKDGEIDTIKNEAMQIKKRYRQLENQLKTRDQKLNDLQKQIELHTPRIPAQPQEDPHLTLRLRELKSIIDDLQKQNIEQRMEIAQLRRK
jgi:chromosome segregation ATPase